MPVRQQSTAFLQMVTLSSPDGRYDGLYLSNYATINLVDELSRVPGVGHASVFGAGKYAMRIWLDPDKLVALGPSPQEVIQAVQQQNQEVAAGQIGMPPAPTGQEFPVYGQCQRPPATAGGIRPDHHQDRTTAALPAQVSRASNWAPRAMGRFR